MSDPIQVMITYIQEFLEKPHPAFHNLPVCPFVKHARTTNKLMFRYVNLHESQTVVDEFKASQNEALVLIFPLETTEDQITAIQNKLGAFYSDLIFFEGHPNSNFKVGDLYTRREPYPNLVVQYKQNLQEKAAKLKAEYYPQNTP